MAAGCSRHLEGNARAWLPATTWTAGPQLRSSCSQSGGVETELPGPRAGRTGPEGQRPAHWKGPRTQRGARGSALPGGGRAPSSRFPGAQVAHIAGSLENTHGVTSHLRKRSRTCCEPGPGAACPLPSLGQHVGLPVTGSLLSSSPRGHSCWGSRLGVRLQPVGISTVRRFGDPWNSDS